jgi:hypothetical protein
MDFYVWDLFLGKTAPVPKYHTMKTYGGVEIKIDVFLTSVEKEAGGQLPVPATLTPKIISGEEKVSCTCRESNSDHPARTQPVTSLTC